MTPAARASAAIDVLDDYLDGMSVEVALTRWGRKSRFAGSSDRAAVRDLVFDALRCKRSFAALGGAMSGRGLVLGGVRASGSHVADVFSGEAHAPQPISDADDPREPSATEACDCPEWLVPRLKQTLGDDFTPIMLALRERAPVFLRVNLLKSDVAQAQAALLSDGIMTEHFGDISACLLVVENTRKILTSQAYLTGLVELQDAASQAVILDLAVQKGARILDYCAGGGGKTLALAALAQTTVFAHDFNAVRMKDLPQRAARSGALVQIVQDPSTHAPFDLVLADVPCSGSGSWRRDPQGKWALTETKLADLIQTQAKILRDVAEFVCPGGTLAYVTCSLLADENEIQINGFMNAVGGWNLMKTHRFTPLEGGDGFFCAVMKKANS
ncbi:MAG: RsmB/NOP family class I SAM-dependent RNA methyltransferase [Microgenomates group bacterium]